MVLSLPLLILILLRLCVVLSVVAVDLFTPRFNLKILGVCCLAIASIISQLSGADLLVTAAIGIPFWSLLALVLVQKIQRDPRNLREYIRERERAWDEERDRLNHRIKELERPEPGQ